MQVKILPFFIGRNMMVQARLLRRQIAGSDFDAGLAIYYRLLQIVNRVLWDANLLITAIFVTRTPFTTFICLIRSYAGRRQAGHSTLKQAYGTMMKATGKIVQSLKSNFWHTRF